MIETNIDISLIGIVSPEQAWYYRIIPSSVNDVGVLTIYYDAEKAKEEVHSELEIVLERQVILQPLESAQIDQLLATHYLLASNSNADMNEDLAIASENFLTRIIHESSKLNSSDVHIEVYDGKARIRIRVDGQLVERYVLDKTEYPSIINRIKIMASLDIAEKRLPQDGRIFFNEIRNKFDIRVSVLPTIFGEKIVLRLLRSGKKNVSLAALGLETQDSSLYLRGISKPNGIILISGPTGSGKTTTLYATLNILNKATKNILTIEDPVEYTIEGINQVQLKESIGFGYPSALKTFLRQDPDIIMLGEIRDPDTATMAVRASLTGHLVLSTIHTNSAWGTISRLTDMGIPSYLLADTLTLSVAQRLLRILCTNCKREEPFVLEDKMQKFDLLNDIKTHYRALGCDKCFYTGYKGRRAIYEVIYVNKAIANAIRNNINDVSLIEGMKEFRTLAVNAVSLFKKGETSLEEIYPILLSR